MAIGGPFFPSQKAGNPSSGTNEAARVQPNPQVVLPIANVGRIMRSVLPMHAQIGEDSRECVARCTARFISYITTEANRQCQLEHRRIVTAEDLIAAMGRLGFGHYVEALTIYLARLREHNANIGDRVVVGPQQVPRVHVPGVREQVEDMPVAPGTPPRAAARAPNPMVGGLSGDEGSGGFDESDGETSIGSFSHVENLNRRNNFSG